MFGCDFQYYSLLHPTESLIHCLCSEEGCRYRYRSVRAAAADRTCRVTVNKDWHLISIISSDTNLLNLPPTIISVDFLMQLPDWLLLCVSR